MNLYVISIAAMRRKGNEIAFAHSAAYCGAADEAEAEDIGLAQAVESTFPQRDGWTSHEAVVVQVQCESVTFDLEK